MYDGPEQLTTQQCKDELHEKRSQLDRVQGYIKQVRHKNQVAIYKRSESWWDTLDYYKGCREELEQRIEKLTWELDRREFSGGHKELIQ